MGLAASEASLVREQNRRAFSGSDEILLQIKGPCS